MNFLALLGWAPDGETTLMSRDELIERFSLERVSPSPAQFDYAEARLAERRLPARALRSRSFAHRLVLWLGENGYDWDAELVARAAPLVQEKIARLAEFPGFAGFLFGDVEPRPGGPRRRRRRCSRRRTRRSRRSSRSTRTRSRRRCARRRTRLELKPRQAFQPIRVAVTGSKVSPGLFESIELLGRETTLSRLRAAAAARHSRGPAGAASAARAGRGRAGTRATTGA